MSIELEVEFYLWAKLSSDSTPEWHPLFCHLVDTAHVTLSLWYEVLSFSFKQSIASSLGSDLEESGRILSFLAALHDIGKISPVFQAKWPHAKERLETNGLNFKKTIKSVPHGVISTKTLVGIFESFGWKKPLSLMISLVLGGHHGILPDVHQVKSVRALYSGDSGWADLRKSIFNQLLHLLGFRYFPILPSELSRDNAFLMKLSGITIIADWIASSKNHFPYNGLLKKNDLKDYCEKSMKRSSHVLKELGWSGWVPDCNRKKFSALFGFTSLRPLQKLIVSLGNSVEEGPSLYLLEAPMGEGKTEAALFLQDCFFTKSYQRGFYVALPTQATSNQMFTRVRDFLSVRYPFDRINFNLLHGQAALSSTFKNLQLAAINEDEEKHGEGKIVAEEWFVPKKRGLLAPFAVGTVDQALLSILQVRHGSVRLFGLAHKVVIIDEIHAYDTYTSTIIQRLLSWLAALGSTVILLSATLPKSRRQELIQAYSPGIISYEEVSYPRVTWVKGRRVNSISFEPGSNHKLFISWVGPELETIGRDLFERLSEGGSAAWICNSVVVAQKVFSFLKTIARNTRTEVSLFHARFPFKERMRRERWVLKSFGKDGIERPRSSILVATQVIEQSLDLDFDIMVTDLAPVDLILQRAGRIHRHPFHRADALKRPMLWIISPEMGEGGPLFGRDTYIYCEYILLRSWLALRKKKVIHLPQEIETLIETVYGELQPEEFLEISSSTRRRLHDTLNKAEKKKKKEDLYARKKMISHPDDEEMVSRFFLDLNEDRPDIHPSLLAATRSGPPSVSVVCLYKRTKGITLDPEGEKFIDLKEIPPEKVTRAFLLNSVSISHFGIIDYLKKRGSLSSWQKTSLLRNHYPVFFEEGEVLLGDWKIKIDGDLGIVISQLN